VLPGVSLCSCSFPAARGCPAGSLPLPRHPPPAAALSRSLPVIFLSRRSCSGSFSSPSPLRASLPRGPAAPSSWWRVRSGAGVRAAGRRAGRAEQLPGRFPASRQRKVLQARFSTLIGCFGFWSPCVHLESPSVRAAALRGSAQPHHWA